MGVEQGKKSTEALFILRLSESFENTIRFESPKNPPKQQAVAVVAAVAAVGFEIAVVYIPSTGFEPRGERKAIICATHHDLCEFCNSSFLPACCIVGLLGLLFFVLKSFKSRLKALLQLIGIGDMLFGGQRWQQGHHGLGAPLHLLEVGLSEHKVPTLRVEPDGDRDSADHEH